MEQTSIYEFISPKFRIDRPIRLIELFAGIGSQAKALQNLGMPYEHWRVCEIDKYAMKSYNAIFGTDFETSDIKDLHASDLGITDTDKYVYILTYSFPCQDLSLAGKQAGMTKGEGTRSGLLWEVERILDECDTLPQVLLMENVPQVIGQKNIGDFHLWRRKLETLGYSNYVELLNAKDFGIPQNRLRCFMVSILGDYSYAFPKPIPLEKRLKDVLEDEVDEKFYLSDKAVEGLQRAAQKEHGPVLLNADLHTHTHNRRSDRGDNALESVRPVIVGNLAPHRLNPHRSWVQSPEGVALSVVATDYKDPTKVLIPEKTKKGFSEASGGGWSLYQPSVSETRNSSERNDTDIKSWGK